MNSSPGAKKLSVARNVYGECAKEKFLDLHLSARATDGNLLAASSEFIVACWESGGGGTVGVIPTSEIGKRNPSHTCVRGHKGPIQDIQICPFYDSIFATSSEDGTVKLWDCPNSGGEVRRDCVATLQGHDKRVFFSAFNPVAEWIIASSGVDGTVRTWDFESQKVVNSTTLSTYALSLRWNWKGSLLAVTSKNKTLQIIDPRAPSVTEEAVVHEGAKPTKCEWVSGPRSGGDHYILTAGFSKMADRELALWDIRNMSDAVRRIQIDRQSSVIQPVFDSATGLVILSGKGDTNIKFFEVIEGDLNRLSIFQTVDPARDIAFAPKRAVDVMRCEVVRAYKMIATSTIQHLSICIPRRNMSEFQADLFPPCPSGDSALTAGDWVNGENADPIVMSMEPIDGKSPFSRNKRPMDVGSLNFGGIDRRQSAVRHAPSVLKKQLHETSNQSDGFRQRIAELELALVEKDRVIEGKDRELRSLADRLNSAGSYSGTMITPPANSYSLQEQVLPDCDDLKRTAKETTAELRKLCDEAHLTVEQLDAVRKLVSDPTFTASRGAATPTVGDASGSTVAYSSPATPANTVDGAATIVELLLRRLAKLDKRCRDLQRRNETLESVYASLRVSIDYPSQISTNRH